MESSSVILPTIWMNVTTSANWTRPPVGIVRVEQALCEELLKIYGSERFKRCIWHDGHFIEYIPTSVQEPSAIVAAVDNILPSSSSFDVARRFLIKAFKNYNKGIAEEGKELTCVLPTHSASQMGPIMGDVLVSVGLDWDQSYTQEFYTLRRDRGIKVVTCCYDLIPVLFPQYCVGDVSCRFKEYFIHLTWGSDAVLCISEQTRKDYEALCSQIGAPGVQTCVIPLGDNVPGSTGVVSDQIHALVQEPFILFVSTIERRKNHEVLYRAYHLLVSAGHKKLLPKLVFVGMPGWGVGDLLKDIELDPLTQGLIIQLHHVTDAELNLLYERAYFCVYPSLYEGWGLPVGEALAFGKVVLASSKGSLPEVGGNLVTYVDPWSAQAWADAILELVNNKVAVSQLENKIVQTYVKRTWHQTATVVTEMVDKLLENNMTEWRWLPGYEMSTQVGLHVGAEIVSTNKAGFLLFGPHRSLPSGTYNVSVWGTINNTGYCDAIVEISVNHGNTILQEAALDSTVTSGCLITLTFSAEQACADFEVRVKVSERCDLRLSLVTLSLL